MLACHPDPCPSEINSFELNSSSYERSRGTPLSDGLRRLFVKSTSQCDLTNYKCKTNEHQCFGGMLEGRLSSIPLVVASSLLFFAGRSANPATAGLSSPSESLRRDATATVFTNSVPLAASSSRARCVLRAPCRQSKRDFVRQFGVVHAGPASTPRGVVQGLACELKSPLPLWLWHLAGLRPFAAAAPLQQGPSPKEPWQRRERRNGMVLVLTVLCE